MPLLRSPSIPPNPDCPTRPAPSVSLLSSSTIALLGNESLLLPIHTDTNWATCIRPERIRPSFDSPRLWGKISKSYREPLRVARQDQVTAIFSSSHSVRRPLLEIYPWPIVYYLYSDPHEPRLVCRPGWVASQWRRETPLRIRRPPHSRRSSRWPSKKSTRFVGATDGR